ncbi:MAG: 50S ribosomal protein L10 [Candidatus Yanofskybacteria bacterium CG10_big_fil_rev_8_21_14_0_10_37_15]|uniref:Large ribosomal subunit protein uL10 n=1 Tax=Candidatus Yanofskybacteria bacterium CG10_big_fil_rev_8_21_14_0_10_37_15 TaxID=1975097 RepID=A0A2H0R5G3_9BACT|nr:MAG: 50S ribosomal protein L10 [Candidatus Yanofskybacteria bacterium CG10_big_fil_rev_8_21_14_0_10_37_15]
MKSKLQKSQDLKKLKKELEKAKISIFTTFSRAGEKGLSVAQMRELKNSFKGFDLNMGASYFVTKKSLIERALKDLKYDGIDVYSIDGSMGIVFSEGDVYAVSKKLYEFSKKNPALKFFGAVLEKNFLAEEAFIEIAKMPSRETLLARLFGMIRYPVSALAVALNEIAKKKESVA